MTGPRINYPELGSLSPRLQHRLSEFGGRDGIPNLFRLLALHEPSAHLVLDVGAAVNGAGLIEDRRLQEIVILRTALLCGDAFEWGRHSARARGFGLVDEVLDTITHPESSRLRMTHSLSAVERSALDLVDAVVHGVPSLEQVERARAALGDATTVAVVVLCSIYVMVAKINSAFDVDPQTGDTTLPPNPTSPSTTR